MKVFFITLLLFLFSSSSIFAATPTPVPTKSTSPTQKPKSLDILNDLKEKIASRVAQLNLVEKRGILGKIDAIEGTQISITDGKGDTRFVDVDELTRFSSPSSKDSFGISDLKKGDTISVLGLYNKQSRRILARFVDVTTENTIIHGVVTNVDSKNFSITIVGKDEKQFFVDIENITKTLSYESGSGFVKSGFSKIGTNGHVIVVGYSDKKDAKRTIALRILLFPNIPKDPRIVIPQEALDPQSTTVPSTGSGMKLQPITK